MTEASAGLPAEELRFRLGRALREDMRPYSEWGPEGVFSGNQSLPQRSPEG